MKADQISAGMVLQLKQERQEAYGMNTALVCVTGKKERPGYKVPWVVAGTDFYKPSDFKRFVSHWKE